MISASDRPEKEFRIDAKTACFCSPMLHVATASNQDSERMPSRSSRIGLASCAAACDQNAKLSITLTESHLQQVMGVACTETRNGLSIRSHWLKGMNLLQCRRPALPASQRCLSSGPCIRYAAGRGQEKNVRLRYSQPERHTLILNSDAPLPEDI